jgi:Phage integrase family
VLRVVLVVVAVAHRRLAPSSSATTSTTERALPSSAVQLRCWSRPTTMTRLPLASDWLACWAWSRQTMTVKNDASCSRLPEMATRNMARAMPPSTVAEQLLEVNGAFSVGPPKSAAGRRTVILPAVVVEALAEHLTRYTAKSPEAFVFLSSQGTHLRRSNFNRRVWQPAVKAAGVDGLRVHDLRHTAGTLATAAGGSLREVMDRLATRPPWQPCATSTSWPTGTPPSPAS